MTHTVLHIDASARHDGSVSRDLSRQIISGLGTTDIVARDLSRGMPHVSETWVGATFTPPQDRNLDQNNSLGHSDVLVAEMQAADTIVIGTAMYNFNIPAALKAWIDQICRVGVTFQYGANGPEGLLTGKKVIIAIATGGTPVGSDFDFASPYLRFVFGFLGITDVTIVDKDSINAMIQRDM